MKSEKAKKADHINISLNPDIYNALMIASIEKDISISKVIETILMDSEEFKKFINKAKEYAELESKLNPSAANPRSVNKEDKDKIRK
ncbi:hypothetical protein [Candidatus Mancarchaeum acidiphilum]|nr:hypothetical protein [Candidatus Mancarchaeum acidiphilum]